MVYDNAMKAMCARVPAAICRWLGVDADEIQMLRLSETVPAVAARQVDALVAVGAWLVLHIEFQSSGEPGFGLRMLEYRVRLYKLPEMQGKRLMQHVIMLGPGTIESGLSDDDLDFRFHVHYLRDEPVEPLLATPELAPLAVLADVPSGDRAKVLDRAATVLAAIGDPGLREALADIAADLAMLRLDPTTIRSIWEDHAMTIPSFKEALWQEELAKAREEGRARAREEDRPRMVSAMLRHRFGADDRLSAIARRLSALDLDECLTRVEEAASLDELADL